MSLTQLSTKYQEEGADSAIGYGVSPITGVTPIRGYGVDLTTRYKANTRNLIIVGLEGPLDVAERILKEQAGFNGQLDAVEKRLKEQAGFNGQLDAVERVLNEGDGLDGQVDVIEGILRDLLDVPVDDVENILNEHYIPCKRVKGVISYSKMPGIIEDSDPSSLVYLVQTNDPSGEELKKFLTMENAKSYFDKFDSVHAWFKGAVSGLGGLGEYVIKKHKIWKLY